MSIVQKSPKLVYIVLIALACAFVLYLNVFTKEEPYLRVVDGEPRPLTPNMTYVSYSRIEGFNFQETTDIDGVAIIIRTFDKFLNSTDVLIKNLDQSANLSSNIRLYPILVSTDSVSVQLLHYYLMSIKRHNVSFDRSELFMFTAPKHVYSDNCCQIKHMCQDKSFYNPLMRHFKKDYGHYKHFTKKTTQFCAGNNLLHYILTDAAIRNVIQYCPHCKYLLVTNGDNTYDANFLSKSIERFNQDESIDIVMVDYLERGTEVIHTQIGKQIDLGAFLYRIDMLKRVNELFIDSMPTEAWPDHYYGADTVFFKNLVTGHQVKNSKIEEVLFTHW